MASPTRRPVPHYAAIAPITICELAEMHEHRPGAVGVQRPLAGTAYVRPDRERLEEDGDRRHDAPMNNEPQERSLHGREPLAAADEFNTGACARSGMNRLAEATSPYLLQHAENPVDWHPWGEDAFERARERGQAGARLRRLQRVPLVSRDGARVVRGSRRRPRS